MKQFFLVMLVGLASTKLIFSQTLYVPNASTNGIANSNNGIGKINPEAKLDISTLSGTGLMNRGKVEIRDNVLSSGESLATIRGYYGSLNAD